LRSCTQAEKLKQPNAAEAEHAERKAAVETADRQPRKDFGHAYELAEIGEPATINRLTGFRSRGPIGREDRQICQTTNDLERWSQEFANSVPFGTPAGHSGAAAHLGSNKSCITATQSFLRSTELSLASADARALSAPVIINCDCSNRWLPANDVVGCAGSFRQFSDAVATSRAGHRSPRSGPAVQHRRSVLARELRGLPGSPRRDELRGHLRPSEKPR
jgi:hypothetical protein